MWQMVPLVLCALVLWTMPVPAWAEAVIERATRSGGFAGMGGFEGTSITVTSGTAEREESRLRFTGAFLGAMQRMAGAGDSVTITRLDRDLVWRLDPEKKTYTESPLTVRGERERQGPAPGARPKERPRESEPSDVVVTRNEFKVEKTGARKTINGFPCEEYLATWRVETRSQKSGETSRTTMTLRAWTTPETAEMREAYAVVQAYHQAYLKKLNLEISPAEARQLGIAAMAGATGLGEQEGERALAGVAGELSKIQGFHVVDDVEWQVEGSGGGGGPSARGGGGPPAGLGELMGGLGKLFGGGQKGGGGEPSRAGQEPGGPLFSFYSEVKSIKVAAPDPSRFEMPAGYTRK